MITEEQQELIDKYLQEGLSAEEWEQFAVFQRDAEFEKELAFQSNLQKAVRLKYREAFQQKLEELKQKSLEAYYASSTAPDLQKKNDVPEKDDRKEKVIAWPWVLPIAAAITLAIIAGGYFWQMAGTDSLTIEHVALGGPSKGEKTAEESKALKAYDQQDYSRAKQLFYEIPDDEKSDKELFYNAMTLLLLNQQEAHPDDLTQAIQYLEQLSKGHGNYKEMAEWYLALAYLAKGDEDRAKVLLNEIAQNPHPYSEEAKKKLKQL